jgi:hypothetical protein
VHVPSEGFLGDEAMKEKRSKRIRKITTVSHMKQDIITRCLHAMQHRRESIVTDLQAMDSRLTALKADFGSRVED